jgi:hypothetical protein
VNSAEPGDDGVSVAELARRFADEGCLFALGRAPHNSAYIESAE